MLRREDLSEWKSLNRDIMALVRSWVLDCFSSAQLTAEQEPSTTYACPVQ
jgi:hypothetical protein